MDVQSHDIDVVLTDFIVVSLSIVTNSPFNLNPAADPDTITPTRDCLTPIISRICDYGKFVATDVPSFVVFRPLIHLAGRFQRSRSKCPRISRRRAPGSIKTGFKRT